MLQNVLQYELAIFLWICYDDYEVNSMKKIACDVMKLMFEEMAESNACVLFCFKIQ